MLQIEREHVTPKKKTPAMELELDQSRLERKTQKKVKTSSSKQSEEENIMWPEFSFTQSNEEPLVFSE